MRRFANTIRILNVGAGMLVAIALLLSGCGPGRYLSAHHKNGMQLLAQRKPADAARAFTTGLAEAHTRGNAAETAQMKALLGWARAEELRFNEAEKYLVEAIDIAQKNGLDASVFYARLAVVRAKSGNLNPGIEAAEKGLELTAERWRKKTGGGSRDEVIEYAVKHPGFPPDEDLLRSSIMSEAALAIIYFTANDMKKAVFWGERTVRHCDELDGIMRFAPPEDRLNFYQGKGAAAGAASRAYAIMGDKEKERSLIEAGIKAFAAINVEVKDGDLLAAYVRSGGYDQRPGQDLASDTRFSDAFNQANRLYDSGELAEAENAFRQVIEQATKEGNHLETARALSQLGWLLAEMGRYAQSLRMLKKSIYTQPLGDEAVMSHTRTAAVLSRLGSFEMSLRHADQALQIGINNRPGLFKDRKREVVIEAFVKNPGLPPDVIMLKAVLGSGAARTVAYYFMGDYERASQSGSKVVRHFLNAQKAITLAAERERRDFYDGIGYAALATGDSYTFVGQAEKGRAYLKRAEEFFEKSGSVFGKYAARALFACTFLREKRYQEGAGIMQEIWQNLETMGLDDIAWRSKTRFAYYFDLHANQYLKQIATSGIENLTQGTLTPEVKQIKSEMITLAREQISAIEVLLSQAQATRILNAVEAIAASDDGDTFKKAAHEFVYQLKKLSYENYLTAIERIESLRSQLETDLNKRAFRADKQILYDGLVRLSVELYGARAGLEAVERAKARDLLDLLATKEIEFGKSELAQRQKELRTATADQLTVLARLPESQAKKEKIDAAVSRYRAIMVQMRSKEPELASLISVDFPSFKEIAQLVPQASSMLEYYLTRDALYIFAVVGNEAYVAKVSIGRKELATRVEAMRRAILKQNRQQELKLSQELYDLLIRPLEKRITGRRLIVIPDNVLNYLPFAALAEKGKYLMDRFSLVFSPSAAVLKYSRAKVQQAGRGVLAFGNPDLGDPALDLPYAQKEASDVATLFPGSTAYFRKRATETKVRQLNKTYDVLHFATHGEFSPADPLYSSLRLAKDAQNDGRLTAAEIFSLKISASLVTLSACRTGLGLLTEGGEIIGMNRSFIYAGAPAVLSSLWSVSDESTAFLMQNFYKKMKTMQKDEALRAAQIELIRSKGFAAPFYWAAFYLTGDWR